MILIFDLDDTLYDESAYVKSGFAAVAHWMQKTGLTDAETALKSMAVILERDGRGLVFDNVLKQFGGYSRRNVQRAVQVYRSHRPEIHLFPGAKEVLDKFHILPKHLLTDGNKLVQQRKVDALGISPYFRKVWITHRYGLNCAKPSLCCFEKIRKMEGADYADMVYIGDNPNKDFVNIKKAGMQTVRVLTGHYRELKVPEAYDAEIKISHIGLLSIDLFWKNA